MSFRLCRIHGSEISSDKASNGVVVKFDVVPLVLLTPRRIMQSPDNRAELSVFRRVAPGKNDAGAGRKFKDLFGVVHECKGLSLSCGHKAFAKICRPEQIDGTEANEHFQFGREVEIASSAKIFCDLFHFHLD